MSAINDEAQKTISQFSYHLGLFSGSLMKLRGDDEAMQYFIDKDIHYKEVDAIDRTLKPIIEAFYK